MWSIPEQAPVQTPVQTLHKYKGLVNDLQSKDMQGIRGGYKTVNNQRRGAHNRWQNRPVKNQDRGAHGRWQTQLVKRQEYGKQTNDRDLTPPLFSLPPLNLLSQIDNEAKLERDKMELQLETKTRMQQAVIKNIQNSYNKVMEQVRSHYKNLYDEALALTPTENMLLDMQELWSNTLASDVLPQAVTCGNFDLLFTSKKELSELAKKIDFAFASHVSMRSSKCTIAIDAVVQNNGGYPTVFIRWKITEKPPKVCKYQLELSPYSDNSDDDKDDARIWIKIKETQVGADEVIGTLTVDSEEKQFEWKKLYKLRMRGFSPSNTICTPFSNSIILYPSTNFITSSILKNSYLYSFLKLLPDGKNHEVSLLYCGSRDGYSANAFHTRCDKRGPTITIVETTTKDIFGGYTTNNWYSRKLYASNAEAFLFSLTISNVFSPRKYPIKNDEIRYAAWSTSANGPCFGRTDICINDNCNKEPNSSDLVSYLWDRAILTETKNFVVKDIEVYSIV